MARALPFILLALLAAPATARAQTVAFTPNDRATHSEAITRIGDAALHYWRMNGIAGCPNGLTIAPIETPPNFDAEGYGGDCDVQIVEEHVEWIMGYRHPIANDRRRHEQRWSIRYVCRIIVHETGHALGLTHQDRDRFRIMGASAEPRIPACGRVARELVPKR